MNYFGTPINDSNTLAEKTGAEIKNADFLAVKYDANGDVVLCGAGENALGIITPGCPETIAKGEDITIQIKNIGVAKAGGVIVKGDEVSVDADGLFVKAVTGKYIVGRALSAAASKGGVFKLQITNSGYKA